MLLFVQMLNCWSQFLSRASAIMNKLCWFTPNRNSLISEINLLEIPENQLRHQNTNRKTHLTEKLRRKSFPQGRENLKIMFLPCTTDRYGKLFGTRRAMVIRRVGNFWSEISTSFSTLLKLSHLIDSMNKKLF